MKIAWFRWRALSYSDRFTLIKALFLLPVAGILLHFFRYQSVQFYLSRITPLKNRRSKSDILAEAVRTAELINTAAWRGLYDATCLRKSMVLWWMLRRRGIDSDLRIGARKENGEFSAHAWVEWQDTVINDAPDVRSRYVIMM